MSRERRKRRKAWRKLNIEEEDGREGVSEEKRWRNKEERKNQEKLRTGIKKKERNGIRDEDEKK